MTVTHSLKGSKEDKNTKHNLYYRQWMSHTSDKYTTRVAYTDLFISTNLSCFKETQHLQIKILAQL